MSITITLSHDTEIIEALRHEWIDLQARSSATSITLTWQWICTWYKYFGQDSELWLLTAHEDDRLIGIAPLMKVEVKPDLGFAWQQLEFIGAPSFLERLDFIIEAGYEQQVIPLFIDKLYEQVSRWDVILLAGLCTSKTVDILQQSGNDWVKYPDRDMVVPYLTLPDTVDEWMQSISRKSRKNLRRYRNMLDKQFPDQWSIVQVTQPDELDETFDHLVYLHQALWEARDMSGDFAYDNVTDYYRDLMHSLLATGSLRMYSLKIDGKPCAIDFCSHYLGRANGFITGTDRDVTNVSLGLVLKHHAIEQAIQEGLSEYSLGMGEQPYKYSFGGINQTHLALRLIGSRRVQLQELLSQLKSRVRIRSRVQGFKSRVFATSPSKPMDEDNDED